MAEASLHAMICDLLGEDPLPPASEAPPRPCDLERALRQCERGRVVAARSGSTRLAVARLEDGRSFVVEDRCPHDGGPLSDGFVDGHRLVCARHGWEFDLETGRCVGRPRICVQRFPKSR